MKNKIIFLDIDGVLNCQTTVERHHGFIGIDPVKADLIKKIVKETGAKIVLSSTWRLGEESLKHVKEIVGEIYDVTPYAPSNISDLRRGTEIDMWYQKHKDEVEDYVILDDDTDILESQLEHWWQTFFDYGLTEGQTDLIIRYLKHGTKKIESKEK